MIYGFDGEKQQLGKESTKSPFVIGLLVIVFIHRQESSAGQKRLLVFSARRYLKGYWT